MLYPVLQILVCLLTEHSVHYVGIRTTPPHKCDLNAATEAIVLPPIFYT